VRRIDSEHLGVLHTHRTTKIFHGKTGIVESLDILSVKMISKIRKCVWRQK